jgi:hypothetical protein
MTAMLFAYANSRNSSPFLFVSSRKVRWPVTSLYIIPLFLVQNLRHLKLRVLFYVNFWCFVQQVL